MKKAELNKYLEKGFKEKLISDYKKKKYRYVKEYSQFYFTFMYSSVNLDEWYPTTFSFGIGSIKLKKILEQIFPKKYIDFPENQFRPHLIYSQISLFDKGKYPILEYDIKSEVDAQKMVDEVSDYILNKVLLEWEANPTLEYLEKKVNEKLVDVPNFSGLILAKLVNNPNYEIIKAHFIEVSKDWAEWDKEDLQKVILFLDSKSQEELLEISEMK
jgi:hypothetical protein